MRVMPSQEMIDRATIVSDQIRQLEFKMNERRAGIRKIVLDDLTVYAGITKKNEIRLMANDRALRDYPCGERIAIWSEIKDLING